MITNHEARARLSPSRGAIFDRAAELCDWGSGARLLDVGCGDGELALSCRGGACIAGVDIDGSLFPGGAGALLTRADACELPFADGSFDGAIFLCSLSKIERPGAALAEARRVVRPGGGVAVADFYADAPEDEREYAGLLGRVETRGRIEGRAADAGLSLRAFEDFSSVLPGALGQMIFDLDDGVSIEELLTGGEQAGALPALRYGLFVFGR